MKSGIRYYCYVGSKGVCIAAKKYIVSMLKKGINIDVRPLNEFDSSIMTSEEDKLFLKAINQEISYNVVIAHCLRNRFEEIRSVEKDKKVIGLVAWETTFPSLDFIKSLKYVDSLIVPSEWNKIIFSKHFKGNVSVIHHVINPNIKEKPLDIGNDHFMFYFIGEWCERKNIESLIRCFNECFTKDDKVILYIKTFMFDNVMSKDSFRKYVSQYVSDKIIINIDEVNDKFIDSIHARGDCFFSLSRGEGVGIPICDAAYHGKIIVTPNFGGQMDYIKDSIILNHYTIPANACSKYHVGCYKKCKYYSCYEPKYQRWASFNDDNVIKLMRNIYEKKIDKKCDAEFTRKNFTMDIIGKKFIDLIK